MPGRHPRIYYQQPPFFFSVLPINTNEPIKVWVLAFLWLNYWLHNVSSNLFNRTFISRPFCDFYLSSYSSSFSRSRFASFERGTRTYNPQWPPSTPTLLSIRLDEENQPFYSAYLSQQLLSLFLLQVWQKRYELRASANLPERKFFGYKCRGPKERSQSCWLLNGTANDS